MKRLLMLPLLLLGLSFACDQPHEEIAGYKIGCQYHDEGFDKWSDKKDSNIAYFSGKKNIGPFDHVDITTLKGNIAIINMYIDPSYYLDESIISDISKSMDERWGQFRIGEYGIYENNKPRGGVIGRVSIYKPNRSMDEKLLSVTYTSKSYLDYVKEKENLDLEKKKEESDRKEEIRRKTYADF